jgi:hypothetical protein
MVAYIAVAKSIEERDIESLHSFAFDALRHSVGDAEYDRMLEIDTDYRHAMATDASAFAEQLPFYQVRPLYTASV